MKLLTKTNLYYLVILLAVFTVGGVLFYFSLLSVINENNLSDGLTRLATKGLAFGG